MHGHGSRSAEERRGGGRQEEEDAVWLQVSAGDALLVSPAERRRAPLEIPAERARGRAPIGAQRAHRRTNVRQPPPQLTWRSSLANQESSQRRGSEPTANGIATHGSSVGVHIINISSKSPEAAEGKEASKVTKQEKPAPPKPETKPKKTVVKKDDKGVKAKKGGTKGRKEDGPAQNGETKANEISVSRSSVSVSSIRSLAPSLMTVKGQNETVRVKGL